MPAMPPDVRRWLGPAENPSYELGFALGAGLAPWSSSNGWSA